MNELKEISSLKDEKKIPFIQEIIKDKSEGKAQTIKEIRGKASLHKKSENIATNKTKASSKNHNDSLTVAIKNFDKGVKLSPQEKKILKSFFTEEVAKRKKDILTLHKEINEITKKKNRIK